MITGAAAGCLTVGPPPPCVGMDSKASMIKHAKHGHVATFYPDANAKPLVSFSPLVWGKLSGRVRAATEGKHYGELGYGLHFDQQLPVGSTIRDALGAVQVRLDALGAAAEDA